MGVIGSRRIKWVNHPLDPASDQCDRSIKHIRRLRKDFPKLYQQVLENKLTVTEAATKAGFYPKRVSVNLTSAGSAAATIIKASNTEYAERLAAELEATISFETNASLGATAAFNRTLQVAINAIKQAQEIQDASVDNVEFDAKLIAELEASVALVKQGSGKLPQRKEKRIDQNTRLREAVQ